MSLRSWLRTSFAPVLWRSGLLGRLLHVRNERTLTVVGLHRVLEEDDPRSEFAMPMWTISSRFFKGLVDFLGRNYSPVSLDDVITSRVGGRQLPKRPLLLTFDDGWADTADTALPILRQAGMPAVVFMVSGRLGQREGFWNSEWYAALVRTGQAERQRVWSELIPNQPMPASLDDIFAGLLSRLKQESAFNRRRLLDDHLGGTVDQGVSQMLDVAQLGALLAGGFALGAHSVTHEPLATVDDPFTEIRNSLNTLDEIARRYGHRVRSFSFPHGSYNPAITSFASAAGAELLFTSDHVLTPLVSGAPPSPLIGRVWFNRYLADEAGGICESDAAWGMIRYRSRELFPAMASGL